MDQLWDVRPSFFDYPFSKVLYLCQDFRGHWCDMFATVYTDCYEPLSSCYSPGEILAMRQFEVAMFAPKIAPELKREFGINFMNCEIVQQLLGNDSRIPSTTATTSTVSSGTAAAAAAVPWTYGGWRNELFLELCYLFMPWYTLLRDQIKSDIRAVAGLVIQVSGSL